MLSCAQLFSTQWTIAYQASLSKGFSWQEYWSGLQFLSPGDLPNPGIKPMSPTSPALLGGFFTTAPPGKPLIRIHFILIQQFYRWTWRLTFFAPLHALCKIYIIWQDVKGHKHLINQKHFLSNQSEQSWCHRNNSSLNAKNTYNKSRYVPKKNTSTLEI